MAFDFAKAGRALHGYSSDTHLGYQQIKPMMLDELSQKLKGFNLNWQYEKFIEANQKLIPAQPGVYMFIVRPRSANIEHHCIILYFGESGNLRSRFKQYVAERDGVKPTDREHIKVMLNIYKNRLDFAYVTLGRYQTNEVEDLLIDAFDPCCNHKKSAVASSPAFLGE